MSLAYSEPRVKEDEEKEELRTVLQSGILKRAPNLQRFLEFVAEEYFAGNADQVKEYSIAVQALHRPEQFDPQSDTIVRVTAHALRKKLEQYYATEGASHDIQIHLPAGKYVLQFVRKEPDFVSPSVNGSEALTSSSVIDDSLAEISPVERVRNRQVWLWLGIAAAAILAAGMYLFKQHRAAAPLSKVANTTAVGSQNSAIRIRFGESRPAYVDAAGQSWTTEQYCKGGSTFVHSGHDVQGTDDPAIFREGRKGRFQCRIPVPPGDYQLQLLFADTAGAKVNAGYVDFTINNRVVGALDIVDEAGGNDIAIGKVYEGIRPMSDGTIHLDFGSDTSFVNAVELTRMTSDAGQPLRMLAGPAVFRDDSGNLWLPERFFQGGRRTSHEDALPKVANARLFAWERYGHFRYMLPVVPGREYTLRMYFFEGWFGTKSGGTGGVGSRVFDVYCNGTTLLKDFDILQQQASGTATVIVHHVKPTAHGMLELYFAPVKNYPLINAIEVDPEN
jgi:Malectin domain